MFSTLFVLAVGAGMASLYLQPEKPSASERIKAESILPTDVLNQAHQPMRLHNLPYSPRLSLARRPHQHRQRHPWSHYRLVRCYAAPPKRRRSIPPPRSIQLYRYDTIPTPAQAFRDASALLQDRKPTPLRCSRAPRDAHGLPIRVVCDRNQERRTRPRRSNSFSSTLWVCAERRTEPALTTASQAPVTQGSA